MDQNKVKICKTESHNFKFLGQNIGCLLIVLRQFIERQFIERQFIKPTVHRTDSL